jgi:hypothetical protein
MSPSLCLPREAMIFFERGYLIKRIPPDLAVADKRLPAREG